MDISNSEKFKQDYEILLQKVKEKFRVKDAKFLEISEPKASRILNGLQFDILTLIEMASFVNIDVELFYKERVLY